MNSNIEQEFEDIRQSVLRVRQCYAEGYSIVASIMEKIATIEQALPKSYVSDLLNLRGHLQLLQKSHLKTMNDQLSNSIFFHGLPVNTAYPHQ